MAGFFSIGGGPVDDPGLDGFIERGGDAGQGLDGIVLLAGGHEQAVTLLELAQARLDTAIVQMLALTAAHAAFGGLRIGHKSVSLIPFEARDGSQTPANVNRRFNRGAWRAWRDQVFA